ncbi:unnamed protein product [Caretta caretta]
MAWRDSWRGCESSKEPEPDGETGPGHLGWLGWPGQGMRREQLQLGTTPPPHAPFTTPPPSRCMGQGLTVSLRSTRHNGALILVRGLGSAWHEASLNSVGVWAAPGMKPSMISVGVWAVRGTMGP